MVYTTEGDVLDEVCWRRYGRADAVPMKTSRTQVDRLLDPQTDITLGSLQRAAEMVGRRVNVGLV